MSTKEGHKERYEHNKLFLDTINEVKFGDWLITVCFYCSLHKVSQCMHYVYGADDSDICSHEKTKNYLKNKNYSLFQDYAMLYSLSRTSRYDCINVSGKTAQAKDLLSKIESKSTNLMATKAMELLHP